MIECSLPPKSKYKKGLERDLHNLEIRLELQKKWVANTEREIKRIEEKMRQVENE